MVVKAQPAEMVVKVTPALRGRKAVRVLKATKGRRELQAVKAQPAHKEVLVLKERLVLKVPPEPKELPGHRALRATA
jgi:hypothetical protein